MAPGLRACSQDGDPRRLAVRSAAPRAAPKKVANGRAGDRGRPLGRDRGRVHHRQGLASHGIVEQHQGVVRRQPEPRVGRKSGDPLRPDQVRRAVFGLSPEQGRHRVGQRTGLPWMDSDLGRQFGRDSEGAHGPLGQGEPVGQGRHSGRDLGGGDVSEGLHRPFSCPDVSSGIAESPAGRSVANCPPNADHRCARSESSGTMAVQARARRFPVRGTSVPDRQTDSGPTLHAVMWSPPALPSR